MNNSSIYEYTFSVMRKVVERHKKDFEEHFNYMLYKPSLVLENDASRRYTGISSSLSKELLVQVEYLVMRLLKNNNIEYYVYNHKTICEGIPFYRIENNKKIAYVFSEEINSNNYKEYLDNTNADGLKHVLLGEKIGETIDQIWRYEEKKSDNKLQYITIKDVFELIGSEEYSVFCEHVNAFNAFVRHAIGYNTIAIPSDYSVNEFKKVVLKNLQNFKYEKYFTGLDNKKLKPLYEVFFEKGLINALLSDNDFAESFISAEWYYNTQMITTAIENTAVVAGYFKSIEQLLYKLIRFYDDTGKTIKKKYTDKYIPLSAENESIIDFSLGSMTGFIYYAKHRSIWNVDDDVISFIHYNLREYREKYRNDHFHKDNLFDKEEVDEIREHTILLYYMLLGGIKLNEISTDILLAQKEEEKDEHLFNYDTLSGWLDGILGGDNLLDINNNVYIQVNKLSYARRVYFTSIKGVQDNGLNLVDGCDPSLFLSDDYLFVTELSDVELEKKMMVYIRKYLNEGTYREKLKSFNSLYVGLDIRAKQVV